MGATQTKVIAELKKIAEAKNLEADFEFSFSNVGRVLFRRGFETVANASLDFQSDYLTAAVARGDLKAVRAEMRRKMGEICKRRGVPRTESEILDALAILVDIQNGKADR